jgi:hypothetical protein
VEVAVVEQRKIPVGQPPNGVLVRVTDRIVDKRKLVVFSPHPPNSVPRRPIDLRYLIQVTGRKKDVPVSVQLKGIAVNIIDGRCRKVLMRGVGNLKVVPTPPLEDDVLGLVELLG